MRHHNPLADALALGAGFWTWLALDGQLGKFLVAFTAGLLTLMGQRMGEALWRYLFHSRIERLLRRGQKQGQRYIRTKPKRNF